MGCAAEGKAKQNEESKGEGLRRGEGRKEGASVA